jgi:hypothetical protein
MSTAVSSENAIVPNGNNLLAVHCNTHGGRYVDVGIDLVGL